MVCSKCINAYYFILFINLLIYYRLGIYGFLQILNKKQNYHQGVLTYLKKKFRNFHLKNSKLLNTVVDQKLSSVFDKIKF
jgi:hypothetical protein